MDLSLDSEQESLVAATAEWCRARLPLDQARSRPASIWGDMQAMGWTGMTAPGMELSHATEALVFAELGEHLAPIALIPTAVFTRVAGPSEKAALAIVDGNVLRVLDGDGATLALGGEGSQLATYALRAGLHGVVGLDPTTSLTRISPAPSAVPLGDERAALHLQLLAAAFAVGCADAALDMAAGYAKVREQFGRPIGWFQSLKHMCADMAVRCAAARSQLSYAACALDANAPDAAFHIASAKRLADQAALENSRANIQIHGGIGMTDDAYPHLCLKRAHLLSFVAPASQAVILGDAA